MANVYLKAAMLTAALALLGFFFISQLDAMRTNELKREVGNLAMQAESERQMFLYWQLLGNGSGEMCSYFSGEAGRRASATYDLTQKISAYEKSNVLGSEYDGIRRQYYISNAGLYINLLAAEKYCGTAPYKTILFFYRIGTDCPECRAQGGVLDSLQAGRSDIRVFAFPIDSGEPVIGMLANRSNVTSVPAVVVGDGKPLFGLVGQGELERMVGKPGGR
ncbi:MAG: hypothetical protein NTX79_05660 [Candidatus Micrarchaeota archaeon]|nr:hypothetical protein [Candidatus Micrarchaeota archaeon]